MKGDRSIGLSFPVWYILVSRNSEPRSGQPRNLVDDIMIGPSFRSIDQVDRWFPGPPHPGPIGWPLLPFSIKYQSLETSPVNDMTEIMVSVDISETRAYIPIPMIDAIGANVPDTSEPQRPEELHKNEENDEQQDPEDQVYWYREDPNRYPSQG